MNLSAAGGDGRGVGEEVVCVFDEVAADVLTGVITAAGRRLGTAALAHRGRRYGDDVAIAKWFDTYRLSDRVLALPDLPSDVADGVAEMLRGNEVQAVL